MWHLELSEMKAAVIVVALLTFPINGPLSAPFSDLNGLFSILKMHEAKVPFGDVRLSTEGMF